MGGVVDRVVHGTYLSVSFPSNSNLCRSHAMGFPLHYYNINMEYNSIPWTSLVVDNRLRTIALSSNLNQRTLSTLARLWHCTKYPYCSLAITAVRLQRRFFSGPISDVTGRFYCIWVVPWFEPFVVGKKSPSLASGSCLTNIFVSEGIRRTDLWNNLHTSWIAQLKRKWVLKKHFQFCKSTDY